MNERFSGLKKVPKQPALRLLALSNLRLETRLSGQASASVEEVLTELDGQGATVDTLKLVASALPPREAIWWACLAAEDYCKATGQVESKSLKAARDWVFKPTDENRTVARNAGEASDPEDNTIHCARAVAMCDGKLGPGDLSEHDAPAGIVAASVMAMNAIAIGAIDGAEFEPGVKRLIDRGLDIARGGNGRLGDADQDLGAPN